MYVQLTVAGNPVDHHHYRAIHLHKRNLRHFLDAIGAKFLVNAVTVRDTIRITEDGLYVRMDDEMIHELVDGQDMRAEFYFAQASPASSGGGDADTHSTVGNMLTLRY